jgi:hypothetical protein
MNEIENAKVDVKVTSYEIKVGFSLDFESLYVEVSYSTCDGWCVDHIEKINKDISISQKEIEQKLISIADANRDVVFIINQMDRALSVLTEHLYDFLEFE